MKIQPTGVTPTPPAPVREATASVWGADTVELSSPHGGGGRARAALKGCYAWDTYIRQ